jgi:antitoxin (DNA-binding transcriptional repressor) of toxin-antitoxin stability system
MTHDKKEAQVNINDAPQLTTEEAKEIKGGAQIIIPDNGRPIIIPHTGRPIIIPDNGRPREPPR